MKEFDLIISGGGVAGLTLALALIRKTALRIALVEQNPPSATKAHGDFDSRVVALSRQSQQFLQHLGIALNVSAEPIEKIQISDSTHLGLTELVATELEVDALGYVVELAVLGEQLYQQLQAHSEQIHWYSPDNISHIQQEEHSVEVTLQSGQTITARLLVVAEGAQSASKKRLKINNKVEQYEHSALIANVATEQAQQQRVAFERFTQNGPLALLPMRNDSDQAAQYSLVWSVHNDEVEALLHTSKSDFLQLLQRATGYRAGIFTHVGVRHSYPLSLICAQRVFCHRTVLIANSAQSLHPIAGQGLNLGLRDVQQLVQQLSCAFRQQQDIGRYALLSHYAQQRKSDRSHIVTATNILARGFANSYWPLVLGRNIGLLGLQHFNPARQTIAKRAMGYQQGAIL